jgi:chemotaxis-related protein WspB
MLALTFSVGEGRYAVDVKRVVQVVPHIALQPMAHAAKEIAGIFDYAGQVVPVVDLGCLLGGEPCPERLSTRIILVETPEGCLGLIAERVTELRAVSDDDRALSPAGTRASGALGPVLRLEDGLTQLLRVESLEALRSSVGERGGE